MRWRIIGLVAVIVALIIGVFGAIIAAFNTQKLLDDATPFSFRPDVEEMESVVCAGESLVFRVDVVAWTAPLQIIASANWVDVEANKVINFGLQRFFNVPTPGVRTFQFTTHIPDVPPGLYERVMIGSVGLTRVDTHVLRVYVGEC